MRPSLGNLSWSARWSSSFVFIDFRDTSDWQVVLFLGQHGCSLRLCVHIRFSSGFKIEKKSSRKFSFLTHLRQEKTIITFHARPTCTNLLGQWVFLKERTFPAQNEGNVFLTFLLQLVWLRVSSQVESSRSKIDIAENISNEVFSAFQMDFAKPLRAYLTRSYAPVFYITLIMMSIANP